MGISRRTFLGAAAAGALDIPQFSFGVLADLQYADKDTANKRDYRRSIEKLRAASDWFNRERLKFVIQLGDLVDLGVDNLDRMLAEWNHLAAPKRHVIGNHDGDINRATLLARLGLKKAYYEFNVAGWRFVVLDGMDWSVSPGWPESSENRRQGTRMLAELREMKERNAQTWNGAVGDKQKSWLRQTLRAATKRGERSVVFCHFPVLAESCRPEHLLWNWREILEILESEPSVAAWMNGHDHLGGYAARAGIHFVTMPGVVENDVLNSARVVDVFSDRLLIRRKDGSGSRRLDLRVRGAGHQSRVCDIIPG